ncbi:MAG: hypothetical protein AAGC44_00440 [Planctomycetota bacterium]
MKKLIARTKQGLTKLHRDEQGAEGFEKLLIIAAIALPLLGLLIFFAGDLREWVVDNWDQVKGDAPDPANP